MTTSRPGGTPLLFSAVSVLAGAIDELLFLGAKHAHTLRVGTGSCRCGSVGS